MPSKKQSDQDTAFYPSGAVAYSFVEGEPGQFPEAPPVKKKKLTPGQVQQILQELAALRKQAARLTRRLNEIEQQHRTHTHALAGPPQLNGVHIDAAGQYWMRRPGGWYPMRVADLPALPPSSAGPNQAQRLVEPKGEQCAGRCEHRVRL